MGGEAAWGLARREAGNGRADHRRTGRTVGSCRRLVVSGEGLPCVRRAPKAARGEVDRLSGWRALLETDPGLNPASASPQPGTGAPGGVLLRTPEPVPADGATLRMSGASG